MHCRPKNIQRITANPSSAGACVVIDMINRHVVMSDLTYLINMRTAIVSHIIIYIGIADDSSVMNDVHDAGSGHIIIINTRTADVCLWRKHPVVIRD